MSEHTQIAMVWWAIVFMLIFGTACAALMGVFPPIPASLDPDAVAAFYAENSLPIRIGAAVAVGTGGFMLPMAAVISLQMVRIDERLTIWAVLQGMGGAMMSLWLVFPAIYWGVAAFDPERAPPITALMNQTAFLTLVTTIPHYIFQVLAIAWVCLSRQDEPYTPFPRWLGYFSLWTFLITEVGAMGFLFRSGPFAWHGLFVFWFPILAFTAWMAALTCTLIRALKHQISLSPVAS
ncbi:MAG: hypothetical protein VX593_03535 [Pseudomonadota bacterium]|nr:hypothetical protein [Pseudomonadota bacterium]MEE2878055.1 hypothetical protein [Pseudomonadota bacterium]